MKSSRKSIYADNAASGWQETDAALRNRVYADSYQWRRFLNVLLPALGVSFAISGVIFFFAYNWTDLHKFIKLGIIEGMIVVAVVLVLFTRWKRPVKQIILTGTAFLVGALFAVYGQIYQTGANAYDFFLAWTVFVTVWAIASGYPPLWLVWIGLVNITIYLYGEQTVIVSEGLKVLQHNAYTLVCTFAVIIAEGLYTSGRVRHRTSWFIHTVALAALTSATTNAISSILSGHEQTMVTLPIALILFASGLLMGFRQRQLFYIATIPFCALLMLEAILLKAFEREVGPALILFMGLVLIAGTTALVALIVKLKKQGYGTTTQ